MINIDESDFFPKFFVVLGVFVEIFFFNVLMYSLFKVLLLFVQTFSECISGWQADCVGLVQHQQSACYTSAIIMGHDVCLRAQRQLRGQRRPRQHMFHIRAKDQRGQRQSHSRAQRTHR